MIQSISLKNSFPHLDFEITRAIRFANLNGVAQVELCCDGETLFDGEPHPEFRSVLGARDARCDLVYAIKGGAHIKIGYTNNLLGRVSQIQNGNPHILVVIAAWAGGPTEERKLHKKLAEYRASGEWFADVGPVRQAIKKASGVDVL